MLQRLNLYIRSLVRQWLPADMHQPGILAWLDSFCWPLRWLNMVLQHRLKSIRIEQERSYQVGLLERYLNEMYSPLYGGISLKPGAVPAAGIVEVPAQIGLTGEPLRQMEADIRRHLPATRTFTVVNV